MISGTHHILKQPATNRAPDDSIDGSIQPLYVGAEEVLCRVGLIAIALFELKINLMVASTADISSSIVPIGNQMYK